MENIHTFLKNRQTFLVFHAAGEQAAVEECRQVAEA